MNENKFPPLPKPKFTETIRGVPCITVTEHEHLMRAYAKQVRAQVQSKSYEEWACDALDERPFPSIKPSPSQQAEMTDEQREYFLDGYESAQRDAIACRIPPTGFTFVAVRIDDGRL